MTLTGISNRGLVMIAILVSILWGCIVAEHRIVNEARRQTELYLRTHPVIPVKYQPPAHKPGSHGAMRSFSG